MSEISAPKCVSDRDLMEVLVVVVAVLATRCSCQDYSVTDIDCQYGGALAGDILSATLKKPTGFQGGQIVLV